MVASETIRKLLLMRAQLLSQRASLLVEVDQKIAEVDNVLIGIGEGKEFHDDGQGVTVASSAPGVVKNMTLSEYLLDVIEALGAVDYAKCAEFYLGENNKRNRQRIHTALFHLKTKGKITLVSKGVWALREQKRRGRPPKVEGKDPPE